MEQPLLPFKTLFIDRGLPGLIVNEKDFGGKPVWTIEWYCDYYKMVHDRQTFYFYNVPELQKLVVPPWHKLFVRRDDNGKVPGHPPLYQRHVDVDWRKVHPEFEDKLRKAVAHWEIKGNHGWRELVDGLYMQKMDTDMSGDEYAYTYDLIIDLRKMMWL